MSILQISKIQQRSGNLVDLPQLDEAEFGWASDTKQLFIGKTTPNENIEVLTSYSQLNFNQINGTVGNIAIDPNTISNGQVLAFNGTDWVNKGGNVGGLLTLGEVSNVKIDGGAIGYVLETDGLGNLSWTPKASLTVVSSIQNVTQADPAVVTTTQDNLFTSGLRITITDAPGMVQLNGNSFFVNILTSNTFALYSDANLTTTIDSTGFNAYSFTTAVSTSNSTNQVTVGDSNVFVLNQEVQFIGDLTGSSILSNTPYYIKTIPTTTAITISEDLLPNGVAGNTKILTTATLTGANVFGTGGRAIASSGLGGGNATAGGANGTVQFNNTNLLDGDADFTWNTGLSPKLLTVVGNSNVGNLNASGVVTATRLISNIATGTAPLVVSSTTQVANLNSATAGTVITAAQPNITSVGTLTSLTVSGNTTSGNISTAGALSVTGNANTGNLGTSRVIATGNISATQLISNIATGTAPLVVSSTTQVANLNSATAGTVITAAQPNITSVGTLTSLTVSGNANTGNLGTNRVIATGNISATQLISNIATGTAPLVVSSTTKVANLNADLLDGFTTSTSDTADTIALRDSSGNISANYFVGNGSQLTGITVSAGSIILNGTSNVNIPSTNGNITVSVNGNSNVIVVTGNSVDINGNISVSNNANITGNANVGNLNATNIAGNGASLTNLNASNLSTGTIPSARLSGSYSISVTSATTAGTVTTNAQPNITSVGTLTSLNVSGNTSFTGSNISLGLINNIRILGGSSGQVLTTDGTGNLTWSSGPTVTVAETVSNNAQPNITSVGALISLAVTGNITSGNVYANSGTIGALRLSGEGGNISNIQGANVTGTVPSATTVTLGAQPNITSLGTLNALTVSGNANVGNIGATNFIGGGGNLTNINASNVSTGTLPSARLTGSYDISVTNANTAGTVTTAAQPNITSVGTLSSLSVTGNISAGNVSATNISGSGTNITSLNANNFSTGTIANTRLSGTYNINITGSAGTVATVTTNAQPNITSVGTLTGLTVSGGTNLATSSGNVGIGITSPEDRLDLGSGNLRFKAALGGLGTYGIIRSYNTLAPTSPATAIRFIRDVSDAGNDGAICLDTVNTERMRITSAGNVGIGITSPDSLLQVNGNARITSLGVGTTASGTTGEIRATNNITAYFSDDRLKTRLGTISNALEKVLTLTGFYYEPNDTAQALGYTKQKEVGVSAQEVQSILPEVVVPAPIDETYLTVRYEKLIPLLIEAIKELKTEIDDLRNKQ
jgi:hypothetical protein